MNKYYDIKDLNNKDITLNLKGTANAYLQLNSKNKGAITYHDVPELVYVTPNKPIRLKTRPINKLIREITDIIVKQKKQIKNISIKSITETIYNEKDEIKLLNALEKNQIELTNKQNIYYLKEEDILKIIKK